MQRYSKKRQAILDYLRSTTAHPSADTVYRALKPRFPALSLGTVYRNLAQLKENGDVRSLGIVAGEERFDAADKPHTHIVCASCGAILDLFDLVLPDEMLSSLDRATGYRVTDARFSGLCPVCLRKQDAEPPKITKTTQIEKIK